MVHCRGIRTLACRQGIRLFFGIFEDDSPIEPEDINHEALLLATSIVPRVIHCADRVPTATGIGLMPSASIRRTNPARSSAASAARGRRPCAMIIRVLDRRLHLLREPNLQQRSCVCSSCAELPISLSSANQGRSVLNRGGKWSTVIAVPTAGTTIGIRTSHHRRFAAIRRVVELLAKRRSAEQQEDKARYLMCGAAHSGQVVR
jgi:hypothetical protein